MKRENGEKYSRKKVRLSVRFKLGAISLAFLILGYQVALFVGRASILRIESGRDHPDTVFVYADKSGPVRQEDGNGGPDDGADGDFSGLRHYRKEAGHSPLVREVRDRTRKVESFRFNPNTASVEDLQRLGFSLKQAESIDRYRRKGGRFNSKEDFARSFVVSDSVFRRLSGYIDIPLVDINKADSAAFDALPGIGGYFARKMVEYRNSLGGYSDKRQLLDIYNFGQERYDRLERLIVCSPPEKPFALWTLPPDELRKHPYIRDWRTAKAIALFRENSPPDSLTVSALGRAGILSPENAARLSLCLIAPAPGR